MTFVALRIIGALVGNRVRASDELAGLDVPEMGIEGYATEPIARMRNERSTPMRAQLAEGIGDNEDEDTTSPGGSPRRRPRRRISARSCAGVSLWDLVQMECLARSRLVVLVKGEGGIGYLYFDRGQIVHAITADRVGEQAALEILAWTNGSFQPCDRPWPETGDDRDVARGVDPAGRQAAATKHRTWWRFRRARRAAHVAPATDDAGRRRDLRDRGGRERRDAKLKVE